MDRDVERLADDDFVNRPLVRTAARFGFGGTHLERAGRDQDIRHAGRIVERLRPARGSLLKPFEQFVVIERLSAGASPGSRFLTRLWHRGPSCHPNDRSSGYSLPDPPRNSTAGCEAAFPPSRLNTGKKSAPVGVILESAGEARDRDHRA